MLFICRSAYPLALVTEQSVLGVSVESPDGPAVLWELWLGRAGDAVWRLAGPLPLTSGSYGTQAPAYTGSHSLAKTLELRGYAEFVDLNIRGAVGQAKGRPGPR